MPKLDMNHFTDFDGTETPRHVPAFRTMLAGSFAASGGPARLAVHGMLARPAAGRAHHVLPGCKECWQIEQAETQLARDAVDIVVLDLDGPVDAVLWMVKRLRAAAGHGVIFIGILARHATAPARLYLTAVVDEVVEAPLRSGSLHRAIEDALQEASECHGLLDGASVAAASRVRH